MKFPEVAIDDALALIDSLDFEARRALLLEILESYCLCELRGEVPEMLDGGLCGRPLDHNNNCGNEEAHL